MPSLEDYADQFAVRLLQETLATATSSYWIARAEAFEAVGTPACDEIAIACRNRSRVALLGDVEPLDHIICTVCGTPTSPWSCSCGETRLPEVRP